MEWFRTNRVQSAYSWLPESQRPADQKPYRLTSKWHLLSVEGRSELVSSCGTLVLKPEDAQRGTPPMNRRGHPLRACSNCSRLWEAMKPDAPAT